MINTEKGITTITCDKCKKESIALERSYNEVFFSEGWGLYPHARKYEHLCRDCQPSKSKKAR